MPFASIRLTPRYRVLSLGLTALVASFAIVASASADECSEIFMNQNEGLIEGMASRAALIYELKHRLPQGQYEVLTDGTRTQILDVSYTNDGIVQFSLDGTVLVSNRAVRKTSMPDGSQTSVAVRYQLRGGNRLLIANTTTSGNFMTPEGLIERDSSVEITLRGSTGGADAVVPIVYKETILRTAHQAEEHSTTNRTSIEVTAVRAAGATKPTDTVAVATPPVAVEKKYFGPAPVPFAW